MCHIGFFKTLPFTQHKSSWLSWSMRTCHRDTFAYVHWFVMSLVWLSRTVCSMGVYRIRWILFFCQAWRAPPDGKKEMKMCTMKEKGMSLIWVLKGGGVSPSRWEHVPSFVSSLLSIPCLLMNWEYFPSFLHSLPVLCLRLVGPLLCHPSFLPLRLWQHCHPCLVCPLSLISVASRPTQRLLQLMRCKCMTECAWICIK